MERGQSFILVVIMVLVVAFGLYGCAAKPTGPKD